MYRQLFLLLLLSYIFSQNLIGQEIKTFATPGEKHIITSDGVDLYVMVKGNGKPCLVLHGGPGSGSYYIEKLAGNFLEKNFMMIYLDQRGSVRSSSPVDNNYTMDRLVGDFEEVRNELGIDKWYTLGHSFGGILQMGYQQRHPDRILGMMMINCSLNLYESFSESWYPKACSVLGIDNIPCPREKSEIGKLWYNLIDSLISYNKIWMISFRSIESMYEMGEKSGDIPQGNRDFEKKGFLVADYYEDFKKQTENVKIPVLFYYGKRDWSVGPEHYKSVRFKNMKLWGNDTEHMTPFLSGVADLENAINSYVAEYNIR